MVWCSPGQVPRESTLSVHRLCSPGMLLRKASPGRWLSLSQKPCDSSGGLVRGVHPGCGAAPTSYRCMESQWPHCRGAVCGPGRTGPSRESLHPCPGLETWPGLAAGWRTRSGQSLAGPNGPEVQPFTLKRSPLPSSASLAVYPAVQDFCGCGACKGVITGGQLPSDPRPVPGCVCPSLGWWWPGAPRGAQAPIAHRPWS